ncbi:hypothetical protein TNCV_1948441 [Trichonephila clavipes]|nr:hypothetical protein TNCV_3078341 [Trichonephila clavipes]GFW21221.1 hypothetical protein TNCV_1948441 [Trichonephila clavipes]
MILTTRLHGFPNATEDESWRKISLDVILVTWPWFKITRSISNNIHKVLENGVNNDSSRYKAENGGFLQRSLIGCISPFAAWCLS